MNITVSTQHKRQIVDITSQVEPMLKGKGLAHIFVKHTTAAIMLADLDPGTDHDFLNAFKEMTPSKDWSHPHDPEHFPDHLWASIIGPGQIIPYSSGKLMLGNWQRLVLVELDGPRTRQLELTLVRT